MAIVEAIGVAGHRIDHTRQCRLDRDPCRGNHLDTDMDHPPFGARRVGEPGAGVDRAFFAIGAKAVGDGPRRKPTVESRVGNGGHGGVLALGRQRHRDRMGRVGVKQRRGWQAFQKIPRAAGIGQGGQARFALPAASAANIPGSVTVGIAAPICRTTA